MTNLSFYPEDDDQYPKKTDPADTPTSDDPEEDVAEETETSPEVDEDDLIDDGIEEGEEIK